MRWSLHLLLLVPAVVLSTKAAPGQIVQQITPSLIADAIQLGQSGVIPSTELVKGGAWAGRIDMGMFSTPYLRVALAARQAKITYRAPFTAADVTPDMVAPELYVYASSQTNGPTVINVVTVVITPHGGSPSEKQAKAIHPVRFEVMPMTFQNLFGFKAEGTGWIAVFPLSALSEDNDLHVVYDRECNANHWAVHMAGVMSCTDCDVQFKLKGIR